MAYWDLFWYPNLWTGTQERGHTSGKREPIPGVGEPHKCKESPHMWKEEPAQVKKWHTQESILTQLGSMQGSWMSY